jgi:integrase
MFTIPTIVTTDDLTKRSYITFYYNNERVREYHAINIGLKISPNRAKTLAGRNKLLETLRFEYHKALESNTYPVSKVVDTTNDIIPKNYNSGQSETNYNALQALFIAIRGKLKAGLSKKYKRNLKAIYRQFRDYMTVEERADTLDRIKVNRVDTFLSQFGSSGTYYMNKRRDLGVLFSSAGRITEQSFETIKASSKRKAKSKLHMKYEKAQLKPILNYLKINYPNLYICCLLTYSSWLRPHEEVRQLTHADFGKEYSEVHLTGGDNKGGKVRVVHIPDYVRAELVPLISSLDRNLNIFTRACKPFNESYFNTQWSRAYKKMFALGLIYENQTIYSFRHTAAVDTYRRTKDVYLLQKLLGHSSILVTLKYLRSLGEFNSDELRDAAPQLD